MLSSTFVSALPLLLIAKTAFAGCETRSYTSCADNIVHWYDPNTGEVCDPLDCGGGRAPPKTDVPGCPQYAGTAVPTTSYLSCWTASASATATDPDATSDTTAVDEPTDTSTIATPSAIGTVTGTISIISSSFTFETGAAAAVVSAQATNSASADEPLITAILLTETLSASPISTPATLFTGIPTGSSSTRRTNTTSVLPKQTANAGSAVGGSLVGIIGAVVGAVALL